ncbi:MAG: DNA-processing protein DprA [Chloroflexota bacterium]
MATDEKKYWLGFNRVKGIGPAKLQAILGYFGSAEKAWQASPEQLEAIGVDVRTIQSFVETRNTADLDQWFAQTIDSNITILTWDSADYPDLLRQIAAPPPVLYVRGQLEPVDQWAVAVVGTRRLSAYGKVITREIVSGLVTNGITIVSGMARGIDAIAHRTALELNGRTIGVLGSGIDELYPPEHKKLAEQICDGQGAIISEYSLGTPPESRNFPARNRVISGLSLGVVVVEAGERSGALITSRFAVEQDREVFAIPGNINSPVSLGTNRLIQEGAKLVTGIDDILDELNLRMVAEQTELLTAVPDSAEEAALLAQLSTSPIHIDELCRLSGLSSAIVGGTLTLMELKGMVQQVGGMNYVRIREAGPEYDTGA